MTGPPPIRSFYLPSIFLPLPLPLPFQKTSIQRTFHRTVSSIVAIDAFSLFPSHLPRFLRFVEKFFHRRYLRPQVETGLSQETASPLFKSCTCIDTIVCQKHIYNIIRKKCDSFQNIIKVSPAISSSFFCGSFGAAIRTPGIIVRRSNSSVSAFLYNVSAAITSSSLGLFISENCADFTNLNESSAILRRSAASLGSKYKHRSRRVCE